MDALYKASLIAPLHLDQKCRLAVANYRSGLIVESIVSAIEMAQKSRASDPEFSEHCAEFASFGIGSMEDAGYDKVMPLIVALIDLSGRNHQADATTLNQAVYLASEKMKSDGNLIQSLELARDFIRVNGVSHA